MSFAADTLRRLNHVGQSMKARVRAARSDAVQVPRAPRRWLEIAARIGFGARAFVYISLGVLILLAALRLADEAAGPRDVIGLVARQPFGRLWLILLGGGLWAFVVWRALQAVFNADGEEPNLAGLLARLGLGFSGLAYAVLGSGVFELLDEVGRDLSSADVVENQHKAGMLLSLPFGEGLLIAVGLGVIAIGVGNIAFAVVNDFTKTLACSETLCKRVMPLARIGYAALGLSYLPLGVFIIRAGWRSRPDDVQTMGSALDALKGEPGGAWFLGVTALGLIAFGLFALVEARFRRIRAPRDLSLQ